MAHPCTFMSNKEKGGEKKSRERPGVSNARRTPAKIQWEYMNSKTGHPCVRGEDMPVTGPDMSVSAGIVSPRHSVIESQYY